MFDLHIHSLYSNDGEYSPTDLVRQCVKSGIKVMAITDHNTVAATGEAKQSALEHNIDYIPGIEIDCTFKNTNFHVLGLGINFNDAVYKEIENNIRTQGQTISYSRLQKIRELGFNIKEDDLHALSKHSFWPET
ncbi:PHP domain-containing protein [Succinatimonas hippei]|uniref:PHP domain-containing protein n=1 Tax=Succinatimonas hippei TaxID=626938 RepID=UPI00248F51C2|nr:PHP domain-containing protein [Succinatimonas hippei]